MRSKKTKPFVSIIIPARNEEKSIKFCLDKVMKQTNKNFEVVVVNDGSTDRTEEIVSEYPVKLLNFKKGHSAAFARNRGAEISSGNILAFVDSDVIVKSDFVEKIIKNFIKNPNLSALFGPNCPTYNPKTFIQKSWAVKRLSLSDKTISRIAFKKKIFKELGGFDENIFYYEDGDLMERLIKNNYEYVIDPSIIKFQIDCESFNDFIRQRKWQGRGIFCMVIKKHRIKNLNFFSPCMLILFPLILLIFIIFYWLYLIYKTRKVKYSLAWIIIDFFGRFVSLFQFIKLLYFR